MNKDWYLHLQQNGACFHAQTVQKFDTTEVNCSLENRLVDLSHQGLIKVTGTDAVSFLQGQLSNDVHQVNADTSQFSAYCSPKGRVLTCLRLFKLGEDYLLSMPLSMLESTLKRLQMFILRAKVSLENFSNQTARFGITGDSAQAALSNIFNATPQQPNEVQISDDITLIHLPGPTTRFEFHGEAKNLIAVWDQLKTTSIPTDTDYWSLLDIQAGIPTIIPETSDTFVPQMINLQALNGISFNKGCYSGQEVVARTQYLGKLKRRMYRAQVDSNAAPQAGDALYSSASDHEQSIGKVVAAKPSPEGGHELLAVIQTELVDTNHIYLEPSNITELNFLGLPYSI